jgi:hypothetical protein
MNKRIADLQQENDKLRSRSEADGLKVGGGGGTSGGMDLMAYRVDQIEKRAEAADARMARVEDKLTAIQVTLASLATKDSIRNWGLAVAAIVIASGIGVGAMLLQSSGNQLTAFQSGLSAVQAVTAAAQVGPKPPAAQASLQPPAPQVPSQPVTPQAPPTQMH